MKLTRHLTSFWFHLVVICGGTLLGIAAAKLWYLQRLLSQAGHRENIFSLTDVGGLFLFDATIAAILGMILWNSYQRQLARPIARLAQIIAQVQVNRRDVVSKLSTLSCTEMRDLAQATNTMLTRVESLLTSTHEVKQHLQVMLEAAVVASTHHADRLSAQVAASTEMTNALDSLTKTTRQNDEKGQTAAAVAAQTLEAAEKGQQSVQNVMQSLTEISQICQRSADTMLTLEKQSEHINEVVAAIDRIIADITLIAFNATIEAARAREEGRGFGVVALEVKRVAEEVCEATEDIKDVIHELQTSSLKLALGTEEDMHTVARGIQRANDAGDALTHLVETATLTTTAAQHIASAIQQQHSVSEHLWRAADTTQHSAHQVAQESQHVAMTVAELGILVQKLGCMLTEGVENGEHGNHTIDS